MKNITLKEILSSIDIASVDLLTHSELKDALGIINQADILREHFFGGSLETLLRASQTPAWDGDVVSSSLCVKLVEMGLLERVLYHGDQGYVATTYKGYDVLRVLKLYKSKM